MSKNTDGDARVPEDQLKNQALKSGETKTSSSPSESPHSTQISSQFPVQMLLLAARSNQCPQTSSFSPSLSVNCKTVPVLSFGYGSGSSASSRALCFRISTRWPTVNSLIVGAEQVEDIPSTVLKNLSSWLHILGLGSKDVSADWPTSRRRMPEDECVLRFSPV